MAGGRLNTPVVLCPISVGCIGQRSLPINIMCVENVAIDRLILYIISTLYIVPVCSDDAVYLKAEHPLVGASLS